MSKAESDISAARTNVDKLENGLTTNIANIDTAVNQNKKSWEISLTIESMERQIMTKENIKSINQKLIAILE